VLFLLNGACSAEKQQISVVKSLVLSDLGSNPRSTTMEANHYTNDVVWTGSLTLKRQQIITEMAATSTRIVQKPVR
jgi:hypothetical protein